MKRAGIPATATVPAAINAPTSVWSQRTGTSSERSLEIDTADHLSRGIENLELGRDRDRRRRRERLGGEGEISRGGKVPRGVLGLDPVVVEGARGEADKKLGVSG